VVEPLTRVADARRPAARRVAVIARSRRGVIQEKCLAAM
jgi:hypothetical protein